MRAVFSRLSVIFVAFVVLSASYTTSYWEEPTGFDLEKEKDRKLLAFCQGAILRERGLTCTPFAGSSDKWILEKLVPDARFVKALDASQETSLYSAKDASLEKHEEPPKSKTRIVEIYQRTDRFSDLLSSKLEQAQMQRLPGVYLHIEGLMALCRPEFSKLFDDVKTQDRVRQLVEEAWSNKTSPVHRALFGSKTLDEAPLFELELRKGSAQLDMQIVKLLNEKERDRLLDLISRSSTMSRIVHGPPAY